MISILVRVVYTVIRLGCYRSGWPRAWFFLRRRILAASLNRAGAALAHVRITHALRDLCCSLATTEALIGDGLLEPGEAREKIRHAITDFMGQLCDDCRVFFEPWVCGRCGVCLKILVRESDIVGTSWETHARRVLNDDEEAFERHIGDKLRKNGTRPVAVSRARCAYTRRTRRDFPDMHLAEKASAFRALRDKARVCYAPAFDLKPGAWRPRTTGTSKREVYDNLSPDYHNHYRAAAIFPIRFPPQSDGDKTPMGGFLCLDSKRPWSLHGIFKPGRDGDKHPPLLNLALAAADAAAAALLVEAETLARIDGSRTCATSPTPQPEVKPNQITNITPEGLN